MTSEQGSSVQGSRSLQTEKKLCLPMASPKTRALWVAPPLTWCPWSPHSPGSNSACVPASRHSSGSRAPKPTLRRDHSPEFTELRKAVLLRVLTHDGQRARTRIRNKERCTRRSPGKQVEAPGSPWLVESPGHTSFSQKPCHHRRKLAQAWRPASPLGVGHVGMPGSPQLLRLPQSKRGFCHK